MKPKKEEESKLPKTFTIQEESIDEVDDHEQDMNDRAETDKQVSIF